MHSLLFEQNSEISTHCVVNLGTCISSTCTYSTNSLPDWVTVECTIYIVYMYMYNIMHMHMHHQHEIHDHRHYKILCLHTLYSTVCTNSLLYLLKSWSSFFLSTAALGGSTKYRTGSVKKLSVAASILQSLRERQLMAVCSSVPVIVTNCRTLER